MNKVKLTKAQVDAINRALSHYGDADYLVEIHRGMLNKGHEWTVWPALNDLSPDVLNHALKYGYEVDEEWTPAKLDKYGADFKEDMLEYLDSFSYSERLIAYKTHKYKVETGTWWAGYKTFNRLSISEMADALGIEVDEQSSPPVPQSHPQCRHTVKKFQTSTQRELEVELDYELASLYDAMQQGNQAEIERSKKRLAEIHEELRLELVLEGI